MYPCLMSTTTIPFRTPCIALGNLEELLKLNMHFSIAPTILAYAALVSGLGINCRGSSDCGLNEGADLSALQVAVNSIADSNTYTDGRTSKTFELDLMIEAENYPRTNCVRSGSA